MAKKAWAGAGGGASGSEGRAGIRETNMRAQAVLGKGPPSRHCWFSVASMQEHGHHHGLPAPNLIHGVSLGRWPNLFNLAPLTCKYLAPCFPED